MMSMKSTMVKEMKKKELEKGQIARGPVCVPDRALANWPMPTSKRKEERKQNKTKTKPRPLLGAPTYWLKEQSAIVVTFRTDGQVEEAVRLLKQMVIMQSKLVDNLYRLASEHMLEVML